MFKCSLDGCSFESVTAQGVGRHQLYHVENGEAEYTSDKPGLKTLRRLEVPRPPVDKSKYGRKQMAQQTQGHRCSLPGCTYSAPNGQGLHAHMRGHVKRGEATEVSKDVWKPTGPLVVTSKMKALNLRRQQREGASTLAMVPAAPEKRKYIKRHEAVEEPVAELVDMHECSATRAQRRVADAMVIMQVSTMLEEHDPVLIMQALQMTSQMSKRAR